MNEILLRHDGKPINAEIHLKGSKSISNRVLIIRALSGQDFHIENISDSKDSRVLAGMLAQESHEYNAGHAGTSFRFMTAFLALKEGVQILTGSDRMLQRPIGPLVEALNDLGCQIEYLGAQGYPPLKIGSPKKQTGGKLTISGSTSSQFISALVLVAPYMDKNVEIDIEGDLVSRPYLQMTIDLTRQFGSQVEFGNSKIHILKTAYKPSDYYVEGDWSSASYLYEIASISPDPRITISGLMQNSIQGDSKIADYSRSFGVLTRFEENKIVITRQANFVKPEILEFDLIEQPDLCQTLVCMCAANGIQGLFTGLQTLHIKETDRIMALREELLKFDVYFSALPKALSGKSETVYYMLNGQIRIGKKKISINTYDDHRMAMAFAPLALIHELIMIDPEVVIKSYPSYWDDLEHLGFIITE